MDDDKYEPCAGGYGEDGSTRLETDSYESVRFLINLILTDGT